MKAFITTVEEMFRFQPQETNKFAGGITQYSIPKYQREFKWEMEKVETLIEDIISSSKFLGFVALEQKEKCYEIIDGQQRVTTLLLVLSAIFNLLKSEGEDKCNHDQTPILELMKKEKAWIFHNETVGELIKLEKNEIVINIDKTIDVYKQKEIIERTFAAVTKIFNDLVASAPAGISKLNEVFTKLCKSELLLFINMDQTHTTEDIYVDINFKAQQLDSEDIFKGYCFKYVAPSQKDELKELWVEVKTNSFMFIEKFAYQDCDRFLYHYFLSLSDYKLVNTNLQIRKKHILEQASREFIFLTLKLMLEYSADIINFHNNLLKSEYYFEDVCLDGKSCSSDKSMPTTIGMCRYIMEFSSVQYHKLPFFMFVHYLYSIKRQIPNGRIKYSEFKKIITYYYVYSVYFIEVVERKDKKNIAYNFLGLVYPQKQYSVEIIASTNEEIRKASKVLKQNCIYDSEGNISVKGLYKKSTRLQNIFGIIDNYSKETNSIKLIYTNKEYNVEHLIINQNDDNNTEWMVNGKKIFTFSLSKFKDQKNNWINHLIMEHEKNRELKSFDIVTKIDKMKVLYPDGSMPNHIVAYCKIIEQMSEFVELKKAKETEHDRATITSLYYSFAAAYFNYENAEKIKETITGLLRKI